MLLKLLGIRMLMRNWFENRLMFLEILWAQRLLSAMDCRQQLDLRFGSNIWTVCTIDVFRQVNEDTDQ